MALRAMSAQQVRAATDMVLAADNATVNDSVLQRVLDPTEDVNEWNHRVFGLYNGTDGITPPPWSGQEFTADHTHYVVSESAVVDSGDLEDAARHVTEHSFGTQAHSQLICLCHPAEAEEIASFHAGKENNNGQTDKHDFIPSAGARRARWKTTRRAGHRQPRNPTRRGARTPRRRTRSATSRVCRMNRR
jgi:hypothetical protein